MLSDLLRDTAERYAQARQIVMDEHPDISQGDFEQLVAQAVQRLASQGSHLDQDEQPEQRTTTTTSRRK
jgi:hypothetical protein